jgi:hypothetical protein
MLELLAAFSYLCSNGRLSRQLDAKSSWRRADSLLEELDKVGARPEACHLRY